MDPHLRVHRTRFGTTVPISARTFIAVACLSGLILVATPPVEASNGMNMIGFGPESIGMGGADLARADCSPALNINPAGTARCVQPEFGFGLAFMWPSLNHTDRLGNDRDDVLDRYPMPLFGYVHPTGRVTYGVGLFVQGGMGAEYQDLTTPVAAMAASGMLPPGFFAGDSVPAFDDTRTKVSFAKLTPTVAWRVSPEWTVGATLNVGYARAEMKLFPETSVLADLDGSGMEGDGPGDFFFGMDLDDVSDLNFGMRAGVQYWKGNFSLGGAYVTETDLDLDDGTMTLNMSALGLGKVNYDASLKGLAWPRQAGLGIAYRFGPRLLIAGDVDWVDWSSAVETITIEINHPSVPMAPPSRTIPMRMDWEDQWVYALGLELTPAQNWAVRLGYNHGDTPIPASTLRPLFPAIAEDHITAGLSFTGGSWTFDLALEYVLENQLTNYSTDGTVNPFGPGSTETLSQFVTHFMLRRTFSGSRGTSSAP